MKRWALQVGVALVLVVAGGCIVVFAALSEAFGESGDSPRDATLMTVLGFVTIGLGVAALLVPWAGLAGGVLLLVVFVLGFLGEIGDGGAYVVVTGPALLVLALLGLVMWRAGRGTPAARRASAAVPAPPAPSGAPSTPGEEPELRTPPS